MIYDALSSGARNLLQLLYRVSQKISTLTSGDHNFKNNHQNLIFWIRLWILIIFQYTNIGFLCGNYEEINNYVAQINYLYNLFAKVNFCQVEISGIDATEIERKKKIFSLWLKNIPSSWYMYVMKYHFERHYMYFWWQDGGHTVKW